jgi:hypothetical protein
MHFYLCLGTNPFDMEASVTDPQGTTELCEIIDEDDFHYRMNFTPHKDGVHTLSIKHKALHISGLKVFSFLLIIFYEELPSADAKSCSPLK